MYLFIILLIYRSFFVYSLNFCLFLYNFLIYLLIHLLIFIFYFHFYFYYFFIIIIFFQTIFWPHKTWLSPSKNWRTFWRQYCCTSNGRDGWDSRSPEPAGAQVGPRSFVETPRSSMCPGSISSDVASSLIHKFEQAHDPGAPLLACAVCGEVSVDASDFLKKMVPLNNGHVLKVLMLSREQCLVHDRQESQYKGLFTVLIVSPDIRFYLHPQCVTGNRESKNPSDYSACICRYCWDQLKKDQVPRY